MPEGTAPSLIEDLLKEVRHFEPRPSFRDRALVADPSIYARAAADPESYWAGWAAQLRWERPWDRVLEWKAPHARWFTGGLINACVNCVDRHVRPETPEDSLRNKAALLWEGEPGDKRILTYWELDREVARCANALRAMGVRKGDRVAIYLPMVPEAAVAMLACARIGAIHSVVFGGFSAEALSDRIVDAAACVLITADFGWRRGKKILLKAAADAALRACPTIRQVLVVGREHATGRGSDDCPMTPGRDVWWHEALRGQPASCPAEPTEAEDPLFILYTSGTTGKPKGIVHTTGGYLTGVYATTRWVFDLKPEDVFWCTADVGWVTGHSYVVYGPLANGATVLMYEGSPDWPERDRFWKIIEQYGVTVFYTAPTAIRAFMKWGTEWPERYDLGSLRLLGSVGEPINPEAWMWYHKYIGREKCPIVDTWWQTETGAIMITPLPGLTTTKPASATVPFPGISAEVLTEAGEPVKTGGGYAAITKPWPSMLRTIWGDDERYVKTYWSKWPGVYFPGDGAKRDEDGYFWFLGRVDDVMNVAGHRIGTMEVESALVDHPAVAEAAVVGKRHEIKGTAIAAFVTVKEGRKASQELAAELKEHVVKKIGAIARPDDILFTADLPKTRSGKIMRRLLRDIADGKALGDTTTLADPTVVQKLREMYEEQEA
ncbi:MAG: Acetyl-coenzyme A synthetase [Candidatus Omnitrophica bacterium]|nr:Acetyl-coenzyme A synthetase [Candidatus Omnitrophota bacterium]